MDIHEIQGLKAILARLNAAETLPEMRDVEDEVGEILLRQVDEKVKTAGERIFARIGQKRESLLDREIAQLDGKEDLDSKVARLGLLISSMTSEELEGEIKTLRAQVSLEGDLGVRKRVSEQLEKLQFSAVRPLAHELDEHAVESTFMSRILQVGKRMREENSLAPFKEGLNQTQQREVSRYARGG